jgi:membrane-associated phospholipid phosphatase
MLQAYLSRLLSGVSAALIVAAIVAPASNGQEQTPTMPAHTTTAGAELDEVQGFTWRVWQHTKESFAGPNAMLHLAAVGVTWLMVETDVDARAQRWADGLDGTASRVARIPGLAGGMLVPTVLPIWLYVSANRRDDGYVAAGAAAAGQAVVLAFVANNALKALTGRRPPDSGKHLDDSERSRGFRFGFLRGGVFNGWPSGHVMVNTALAASLATYFDEIDWMPVAAYGWAAYVAASVTVGGHVHWLSDTLAGGMMGWAIGRTVGRGFAAGREGPISGVQVEPALVPGGGGVAISVPLLRR